jgi:cytochrome c553
MTEAKRSRWLKWLAVLVILVAVLGFVAWYALLREVPQPQFASMADSFKYGSIGAENAQGLPYWIWFVLPKMFPEYLPSPGGYAALGLPWERSAELPVGFSKKTIGFDRVAINCAFCHTGSVRLTESSLPIILPGGPSHTFDVLGYQRFLFSSANDPRFNTTAVLNAIGAVYDMPWYERLLYRVLIPQTKKALLKQRGDFEWTNTRPAWGHGRIDPFNPVKIAILNADPGDTIGNSDMVPIWSMHPQQAFHWDGLNPNIDEVFRSSALGDGATQKSIPLEHLENMKNWLATVQPPKYPFPVNQALAAQGAQIFVAQKCAQCHGPNGRGPGVMVPIKEIGTDRHRLDMWTAPAAKNYNNYVKKSWKFSHFRKTHGYLAPDLRALWVRGPFLHNGSVPNVRALLMPPAQRPKTFYRGNDLVDPVNLGFVSNVPVAHGIHFTYVNTFKRGNSNAGHLYGTTLDEGSKAALLEYLKTL